MGHAFTSRAAVLLAAAIIFQPTAASAWGFAAHKFLMARAIDLLPAELKPFYVRYQDELVLRSTDPDLWRNVGWEDDPNHFLDFGVKEYGPYPFKALPRDYDVALERFGLDTLRRNGLLPWRVAEMFGQLRRAFDGFATRHPYVVSNVVLFSAVSAHYVQDAYQPLHATINYDGRDTKQPGVHARFERDLFERFEAKLTINPGPAAPLSSPRDAMFDALLDSYQRVPELLKADRDALGTRSQYDADYYNAFFANARPLLERQLSRAVTATASLIVGAWEQAGRPAMQLEPPRPLERAPRR